MKVLYINETCFYVMDNFFLHFISLGGGGGVEWWLRCTHMGQNYIYATKRCVDSDKNHQFPFNTFGDEIFRRTDVDIFLCVC